MVKKMGRKGETGMREASKRSREKRVEERRERKGNR